MFTRFRQFRNTTEMVFTFSYHNDKRSTTFIFSLLAMSQRLSWYLNEKVYNLWLVTSERLSHSTQSSRSQEGIIKKKKKKT